MPHTFSRRQFLVGAGGATLSAAAFNLGLSGCGSNSTTTSASNGSTAAATDSLAPMTMQTAWINDAENIGWFVAIDNGYFKEQGIKLTYLPGGPNISPEAQLLTGKADIGVTSPDSTATAIATQGAPFKIIGTVYQTNPLGILSLTNKANITSAKQLAGKKIAASQGAAVSIRAMLKRLGLNPNSVDIVPYTFDPHVLTSGSVDATADFCAETPYTVKELGYTPTCTLLTDMGYTSLQDTIVVTEKTLKDRRQDVIKCLRAGRQGWEENFKNPTVYPKKYMATWFKGTGTDLGTQTYYNTENKPLIEGPKGIFTITPDTADKIVASFNAEGIKVTKDIFDLSVMQDV